MPRSDAAQNYALDLSAMPSKSDAAVPRSALAQKIVWVECESGVPIRIFKSQKLAFAGCDDPKAMFKAEAVGSIRRQVFERQKARCLDCGDPVKWDGNLFERMHLHEVVPKGKGGEVSLVNSVGLCCNCHLLIAHGNRRPRFGENK